VRDVLSKRRTTFILFLEGFVSVSLQMLMMRQLVPFVGSSVVVSSLVVGFFLGSLSLGYTMGGRVKENHVKHLVRNLMISAFILSICISYPVMEIAFVFLNETINNPLIEASVVLLFLLSPVVFLLGQTVPILTNFYKSNTVSEVAGDSFAINTVGSVLGSFVTGLVLFYYFGMAATIFIDVMLLGLVVFLLLDKKDYLVHGFIYLMILGIAFTLNIKYEKENFKLTNAYNNYEIVEENFGNQQTRIFKMNRSYSSAIINGNKGWQYTEYIKKILFTDYNLGYVNKDILILGAGGFTLSHKLELPKNNYTYVDIDPDIQEVAEKYLLESKINGDFVAVDARIFVTKSTKKYDAIIVDLYSNKSTIPWHVLTKEFVKNVKKTTKEDGIVIFNIISGGIFADEYGKNIYNTINSTFPYCHSVPFFYTEGKSNIIYTCKNVFEKEKTVYVDDLSRSPLEEMSTKE
jgi:spermidine synthase